MEPDALPFTDIGDLTDRVDRTGGGRACRRDDAEHIPLIGKVGQHVTELPGIHPPVVVHADRHQRFLTQPEHPYGMPQGEVAVHRGDHRQSPRVPETLHPPFGQVEAFFLRLPVQGHVERLLIGVGTAVHHRALGPLLESEESAERPAAEFLQDRSPRRDLPVGHSLVPLESQPGAVEGSLLRHHVEEGVERGQTVPDEMGQQPVGEHLLQIGERKPLVGEIDQDRQIPTHFLWCGS